MIYRGHIKNGVVVLDQDVRLPDGTEVKVEAVEPDVRQQDESSGPTLYERLQPFIGSAKGLAPDASKHIDDFLYGQGAS